MGRFLLADRKGGTREKRMMGNAAQRRFCRAAGEVSRKTALPQTETKGMAR
jgi:hypothetical protein